MHKTKKKNIIGYLYDLFVPEKKNKPFSFSINPDKDLLARRLEVLMEERRPFLQKRYHIKDLAADLVIPVHTASGFLNSVIGMHFSDYINSHRIRYCETLIWSGTTGNPGIKELAVKCGFGNRNSFTRAFKKFTGQNPFNYIKNVGPQYA